MVCKRIPLPFPDFIGRGLGLDMPTPLSTVWGGVDLFRSRRGKIGYLFNTFYSDQARCMNMFHIAVCLNQLKMESLVMK